MANLLDSASILLTPTAYNNGSILAIQPSDGSGDFTFSRGSSATRVNEQGLIEDIASNLPRIDYTDGTGSLLLEPQSTNGLNYSEPTSSETSAGGITYESFNWAIGFTNCIKFGDNSQTRYRYFTGTIANSTEYTVSAFVIMDDLSEPILGTASNNGDLIFRVGGQSASNGNLPNVNMGNNIYRVSSVVTSGSVGGSTGLLKYAGQSNKGFRIVGFQVEQNSYATSYIPTQGASSTRLADIANNSGNASLINSEEGVLYAEISALANGGVAPISINDGTSSTNNSITFSYSQATNRLDINGKVGGSFQFLFNRTIADITINHKFAVVWKVNRFELWVDGIMTDQDLLGSVNSANTFTKLQLSNTNTTKPFYGNVKALAIYKTALTDEQLTLLTTI